MKRYSLEVKWSDEDGCYLGRCPELAPFCNMGGAIADGSTWEEAARETEIAARLVAETLEERGETLPQPATYKDRDSTIPRAEVAAALAELQGTIAAHDVRLESCDRDGNEYCDCLERAIARLNAEVAI